MLADSLHKLVKGRIGGKLSLIASAKLRPLVGIGRSVKPFAQLGGRSYLLVPQVIMKSLMRKALRPKAVNKDSKPIRSLLRLIRAFELYVSHNLLNFTCITSTYNAGKLYRVCFDIADHRPNNSKQICNFVYNEANELILYQPDKTLKLDVRVEDETVWLTQQQMAELFLTTRNNVTLHIRNIFKEGELTENSVSKESLLTAADGKNYRTKFYNLDVIISVGYRVKSQRGTQFRQWATKILKEHMLRGYSINQRIMQVEDRMDRRFIEHDKRLYSLEEKVDFIIQASIHPRQGLFFDGQIFDAYAIVADLIRRAEKRIVLIDNYIDDTVLVQLAKRRQGVSVDIYDAQISRQLRQDVASHNAQYPGVTLHRYTRAHDRFLIIDSEVYHFGASFKDLGKKLFCFSKMEATDADEIIAKLQQHSERVE